MRNLASIQRIKEVLPHTNSDNLEIAKVLGWTCVIKKGSFKTGDRCVFFEIDSLLPDEPKYEFLKKTSWNTRYNKIRLKTITLRGQLSQGLLMPLSEYPEIGFDNLIDGHDLSNVLGIEKYEPYIPPELAGDVRSFSWPITKTDETRIQQDPEGFMKAIKSSPFYITCKMDGTSGSFILCKNGDEVEFHVCSRNMSLKGNWTNTYWRIAIDYQIEKILQKYYGITGRLLAIQGEVCGPGIQGNKLGLTHHTLYVFNIVDVETNERFSFNEMKEFCSKNELDMVPVLAYGDRFPDKTYEEMLEMASGKYADCPITGEAKPDPKQEREGIVLRTQDQKVSFKIINNKFLLDGGD